MARMWVKGCDIGLNSCMRGWCWVSEGAGDGPSLMARRWIRGCDNGLKNSMGMSMRVVWVSESCG